MAAPEINVPNNRNGRDDTITEATTPSYFPYGTTISGLNAWSMGLVTVVTQKSNDLRTAQTATVKTTGITYVRSATDGATWGPWVQLVDPAYVAAIASGKVGAINTVRFIASGTYTKPANLLYAIIEVQAAGGGSGGRPATSASQCCVASSGGGGEYRKGSYAASAISAATTVTIGAGGTAGTSSGNGGKGGNSSFGSLITAIGGDGGDVGTPTTGTATAFSGAGGTGGTGGQWYVAGGTGMPARCLASGVTAFSSGGHSFLSGLNGSMGTSGSSLTGNQFGGGAAGAVAGNSSSAVAGNAGAIGMVIITEFLSA